MTEFKPESAVLETETVVEDMVSEAVSGPEINATPSDTHMKRQSKAPLKRSASAESKKYKRGDRVFAYIFGQVSLSEDDPNEGMGYSGEIDDGKGSIPIVEHGTMQEAFPVLENIITREHDHLRYIFYGEVEVSGYLGGKYMYVKPVRLATFEELRTKNKEFDKRLNDAQYSFNESRDMLKLAKEIEKLYDVVNGYRTLSNKGELKEFDKTLGKGSNKKLKNLLGKFKRKLDNIEKILKQNIMLKTFDHHVAEEKDLYSMVELLKLQFPNGKITPSQVMASISDGATIGYSDNKAIFMSNCQYNASQNFIADDGTHHSIKEKPFFNFAYRPVTEDGIREGIWNIKTVLISYFNYIKNKYGVEMDEIYVFGGNERNKKCKKSSNVIPLLKKMGFERVGYDNDKKSAIYRGNLRDIIPSEILDKCLET